MHKKKMLFVTLFSVFLFLAACSSDGKYDSLMSKAEKAMEDLDVETAIKHYEEILELDVQDIPFGPTRIKIVEELLSSADSLQEQLSHITELGESAISASKDIDFEKDSIEKITEVYNQILIALYDLEKYPTVPYYQELVKIESTFEKNIEDKVVKRLLDEIDANISELKFTQASELVKNNLTTLNYAMPTLEIGVKIEELNSKIESEQERFLQFPKEYTKRENVIFEDKNIGKVTFLGEGLKENELYAYFKFEGGLALAMEDYRVNVRSIFSDGTSNSNSSSGYSMYDGYAIFPVLLTSDESLKLKRLDYTLNFQNSEEYKTIMINDSSETATLPAILKVKANQQYSSDVVIEDADKKVRVNHITVDPEYIRIHATVEAKKDIKLDERVNLLIGDLYEGTSYSYVNDEFFMGIPKDIDITVKVIRYLSENYKNTKVYLFNSVINIDLKTGEAFAGEKELLVNEFYNSESSLNIEKVNNQYSSLFFYQDVEGKKFTNVVGLRNGSYDQSNPSVVYMINKRFSKFTGEIAINSETATSEYGSSVLSIIGDGNVLKKVTIAAGQKTAPVEVNIAGINNLEFKLEQIKGTEGYQTILIGNGELVY